MTRREDHVIVAVMALRRADVADAAVAVVEVVPMHELARPVACSIEIGEARVGLKVWATSCAADT